MGFVKAIIGGLIGAIIATGILAVLRDGSLRGYEWFPIITGILTGLGVKMLSGRQSGVGGYVTGAIAALLAMVAILSGDEAIELWKMRNTDFGPTQTAQRADAPAKTADAGADAGAAADAGADEAADASDDADSEAGDSADTESGDDEAETEAGDDQAAGSESADREVEMAARSTASNSAAGANDPAAARKTLKKKLGWRDYVTYLCSGLGMLFAYQLGRGGSAKGDRAKSPNYEETT